MFLSAKWGRDLRLPGLVYSIVENIHYFSKYIYMCITIYTQIEGCDEIWDLLSVTPIVKNSKKYGEKGLVRC